MTMYSKGLGFAWAPLQQDILNDAFNPNNHDMLHALNWMNRHLHDYVQPSNEHPSHEERIAAMDAWCALYPWAPLEIQAHMVLLLQDAPKAHVDLMNKEPKRWCTAMEKAWLRREDMSLWHALEKTIPEHVKALPLISKKLNNALALLRPHVFAWLEETAMTTSLSEKIYDTLSMRSDPDLRDRLGMFQLFYPSLDALPKASALNPVWDNSQIRDSWGRVKLESCTQLASNLLQFNAQHEAGLKLTGIDLPEDAFEPQP